LFDPAASYESSFVVSNSTYAKQMAVQYGKEKQTKVDTSWAQNQPYHINTVPSNWWNKQQQQQ